jgi:glycosyltransferase involved in cell wall biosynthesis
MIREYPFLPGLPAKIEMLNPDIVHAESHLFLPTVQAVRKAKRLGLPCVVSVHGVLAERGFAVNLAQFAYLRTLGLEVFRGADRVVCLTRSDAEEVVRLGCPVEKVRLVPNAVDTELFKPGERREDGLVVWVGRFVPEKDVEYLVEAARLVVEKRGDVRFLLVGYGPLKAKIMKLAQDYGLLGKSVSFVGPLSREEIAKILSKAAVFVFPSLKEGLPLAVLEAMASGVSVVGSDIPGINAVITHRENGILVPPRNPEALANAIMLLLEDKSLRRKLGQNARQLMVEKYSWEIISERIEKVYNEAMEEVEKL